jgi:hypothetical protein
MDLVPQVGICPSRSTTADANCCQKESKEEPYGKEGETPCCFGSKDYHGRHEASPLASKERMSKLETCAENHARLIGRAYCSKEVRGRPRGHASRIAYKDPNEDETKKRTARTEEKIKIFLDHASPYGWYQDIVWHRTLHSQRTAVAIELLTPLIVAVMLLLAD